MISLICFLFSSSAAFFFAVEPAGVPDAERLDEDIIVFKTFDILNFRTKNEY